MSGKAATRLRRNMLRDDVRDIILEMLLSGRFEPGASLGIDAVARELEVSPTPVREALVELEHTGLVTRTAWKGYTVASPLTRSQMAELMDARHVLELATVERAAARAAEVYPELVEAHALHREVVERHDLTRDGPKVTQAQILEYFRADWSFHEAIIRGSNNRVLEQMASGLGSNVHRMRQSIGRGILDAKEALAEHAVILEAFRVGDVAAAVDAMREHLDRVTERALADTEVE